MFEDTAELAVEKQYMGKRAETVTYGKIVSARRDDRAAEGNGLENRRGESHRGFESHSLRSLVILHVNMGRCQSG